MSLLSLNTREYLTTDNVAWNLARPCADCPFRRDAPDHLGVVKSLPEYLDSIRGGTFAHTCHKTDNRSSCDGPRSFTGEQAEHCAGALHFLIRCGEGLDLQLPLLQAIEAGKLDIHAACKAAEADEAVFGSLKEFIAYYLAMLDRAALLRMMKDVRAIKAQCPSGALLILVGNLEADLLRLMPELATVSPWHERGRLRSLDELSLREERQVSTESCSMDPDIETW